MNPHHRQKRKRRRRCHRNSVPNRFSSQFLTSRTNGPRSLSQTKMGTHSALGERSHTRAHTAKQGCFGWGGITTLGAFRTFTNIPGPGVRTANFAAFGSWPGVRQKDAESLRNSDALMRVAVPRRRGPAGLRDPVVLLLMLLCFCPCLQSLRTIFHKAIDPRSHPPVSWDTQRRHRSQIRA